MNVDLLGSTIEVDDSFVVESADEIRRQVDEFAAGQRRDFELSVEFPDGLLGDVIAAMTRIPYGETRSYGDLAADLDTAPVAIGRACGRNPVPVVVPCHRVVGSDGRLRGYSAADGVATKRRLLELERRVATGSVQTRLPASSSPNDAKR